MLSSSAWSEGFAHFFAAKVFNNPSHADCYVGYYKEVKRLLGTMSLPGGTPVPYYKTYPPPVQTSCYDAKRWMRTHCLCGYPTGTEWDWMTGLWNMHTRELFGNDKISMSDYFSITRRACTGGTAKCSGQAIGFHDLEDAAYVYYGFNGNHPKYANIWYTAWLHGLPNDN